MKIDKGIPLPPKGEYRRKFPFSQMEIGDSVFVADKRPAEFAASMQYVRRKLGYRFTTRSENGGTRVWRITAEEEHAHTDPAGLALAARMDREGLPTE